MCFSLNFVLELVTSKCAYLCKTTQYVDICDEFQILAISQKVIFHEEISVVAKQIIVEMNTCFVGNSDTLASFVKADEDESRKKAKRLAGWHLQNDFSSIAILTSRSEC